MKSYLTSINLIMTVILSILILSGCTQLPSVANLPQTSPAPEPRSYSTETTSKETIPQTNNQIEPTSSEISNEAISTPPIKAPTEPRTELRILQAHVVGSSRIGYLDYLQFELHNSYKNKYGSYDDIIKEGDIIEINIISECSKPTEEQKEEAQVVIGTPELKSEFTYQTIESIYTYKQTIPIASEAYEGIEGYADRPVPIKLNFDILVPNVHSRLFVKFKDKDGNIYEANNSLNVISYGDYYSIPFPIECSFVLKHYNEVCDRWILEEELWMRNFHWNNNAGISFCIPRNEISKCITDKGKDNKVVSPECFIKYVSEAMNLPDNTAYWGDSLMEGGRKAFEYGTPIDGPGNLIDYIPS